MAEKDFSGIRPFIGLDGKQAYEVEYEIFDGPIEGSVEPLPDEIAQRYDQLYHLSQEEPLQAIGQLEPLIARYPGIAVLKNWLHVSYASVGRTADADALIERSYLEHPDYLFARLNYAHLLLKRNESDRVQEVLKAFDLKLLYPDRSKFHISEAIGLWSVATEWCAKRGDLAGAQRMLSMIMEVDPENPSIDRLKNLVLISVLQKASERLKTTRGRSAMRKSSSKSKLKPKVAKQAKRKATSSGQTPDNAAPTKSGGAGEAHNS